MKSLFRDDYEIDVLFGEIASIVAIVFGLRIFWKMLFKHTLIVPMAFGLFFVFVPALLLFFLNRQNVKNVKLFFRIWEGCVLLIFLSSTTDVLSHFHLFWKVILPIAFVTICMMIGVKGVRRIKEPEKLILSKDLKIPETYCNLVRLIDSIADLIQLASWFIFMVLIGKYFHDFVLLNWSSFEKQRVMVFYVGIAIGCYPAKISGAAISAVFTVLVNRIYEYYAKPSG